MSLFSTLRVVGLPAGRHTALKEDQLSQHHILNKYSCLAVIKISAGASVLCFYSQP